MLNIFRSLQCSCKYSLCPVLIAENDRLQMSRSIPSARENLGEPLTGLNIQFLLCKMPLSSTFFKVMFCGCFYFCFSAVIHCQPKTKYYHCTHFSFSFLTDNRETCRIQHYFDFTLEMLLIKFTFKRLHIHNIYFPH